MSERNRTSQGERRPPTLFACYGRLPAEAAGGGEVVRARQLHAASTLVRAHGGEIVAEFFDCCPNTVPWHRRPQVNALLAEPTRSPGRFGAVVIGDIGWALGGVDPLGPLTLLDRRGMALWTLQTGGRVDPANAHHLRALEIFAGPVGHYEPHRPSDPWHTDHDGGQ